MAIDRNFARFLTTCQQSGVSFRQTLMLGRQNFLLSIKETRQLLRWAGMDETKHPRLLDYEASRYAETFFQALGAETVESMDASGFEGASIVHDLNVPVPAELKSRFDVVCDGGTIEHVINFPVVIRNCMEMVKPGGHLILGTPGNNFFGHGFYQFSPELWFRLLAPVHGFEIGRIVAVEYGPRARWYEVMDPAIIKDRVALTNAYPVLLMVLAKKNKELAFFETFPQQSDYVPRWQGAGHAVSRRRTLEVRFRRTLLETFPSFVQFFENFFLYAWFKRRNSFRNREFFKPVKR